MYSSGVALLNIDLRRAFFTFVEKQIIPCSWHWLDSGDDVTVTWLDVCSLITLLCIIPSYGRHSSVLYRWLYILGFLYILFCITHIQSLQIAFHDYSTHCHLVCLSVCLSVRVCLSVCLSVCVCLSVYVDTSGRCMSCSFMLYTRCLKKNETRLLVTTLAILCNFQSSLIGIFPRKLFMYAW